MNISNKFSVKRLCQLIINDLKLHAKTILICAGVLVVFFALLPFHVTSSISAYFFILYVGGFIITSFAFNELHNRDQAYLLLTLPCSNLERFLSKWILTSIGYAVALLIVYYLFSLLSLVINLIIFNRSLDPLDVYQSSLWIGIGKYIILQSIVFLGAITFKKYVLLKTALVVGGFFLACNIFIGLLISLFNMDHFLSGFMFFSLLKGWYFIFWAILAPFFKQNLFTYKICYL